MTSNRKPTTTTPRKAKAAKPTSRKPKAKTKPAAQAAPVTDVQTATSPAAIPEAPSMVPKLLSGLDAAALVLREASTPLNAQDLVGLMLERGLWKTEGKTPSATIYAAMIREITAKGSSSRFVKADRGRFVAAS